MRMNGRTVLKGHAATRAGLNPLISVNGSSLLGKQGCECGATSPILRGNRARSEWHRAHKLDVQAKMKKASK
jgi:hypothetical protein